MAKCLPSLFLAVSLATLTFSASVDACSNGDSFWTGNCNDDWNNIPNSTTDVPSATRSAVFISGTSQATVRRVTPGDACELRIDRSTLQTDVLIDGSFLTSGQASIGETAGNFGSTSGTVCVNASGIGSAFIGDIDTSIQARQSLSVRRAGSGEPTLYVGGRMVLGGAAQTSTLTVAELAGSSGALHFFKNGLDDGRPGDLSTPRRTGPLLFAREPVA